MKTIKEFFNSNVIFGTIIKEAKQELPSVDKSFEEWLKDLPNDKGNDEVIEIEGMPTEDKFGNKFKPVASTSLLAILNNVFKNEHKNFSDTELAIIPFENFYIGFRINFRKDKLDDIHIMAVSPKPLSVKSIMNNSKSMYEVYQDLYIMDDDNDAKAVIKKIVDKVEKEFINNIEKKYGSAAQEANAKSKEATPDKSPFKLSKKKQFPDYIKHCLIKQKDNQVVKKYSYWGEAEIFVETVKKDKKNYYKVYMGDVRSTMDNGKDELYTFYLTTLGSLDKFLEYTLKPHRQKMHSELGGDGEIHVWYSSMQKNLPPALKKDCIKDEKLIKELNFHDLDIYELYK